jgi:hypothetical protein
MPGGLEGRLPFSPPESETEAAAAPAEPAHAARVLHPDELSGLDRQALSALMGSPDLTRGEAGMEVWQYRAEDCVLDVYFTPPGEGDGPLKVAYIEGRPRHLSQAAAMDGATLGHVEPTPPADLTESCLAELSARSGAGS